MSELQKPSLYVSRARHLSACLFHVSASGAIIAAATANSRRLSPTKSLQNLCFIGRAWPNFPSFFSTFRKNPNKNHPQVRALCRVCCVLLFEIPGVSNAKAVRFWFCFHVQIPIACHVRAISAGSVTVAMTAVWTRSVITAYVQYVHTGTGVEVKDR